MPTTHRTAQIAALYTAKARELERAVARRAAGDSEYVHDACAFAWEQLVRRTDIVCEDRRTFAWLLQIAVHEAWRLLGDLTSAAADDAATLADRRGHEIDQAERLTQRQQVLDGLRDLTPRQRRYVGLHAAGFTYDEIAAREGVSYTAVNRHLIKARRRLRAT